jgi:hypothetical protein
MLLSLRKILLEIDESLPVEPSNAEDMAAAEEAESLMQLYRNPDTDIAKMYGGIEGYRKMIRSKIDRLTLDEIFTGSYSKELMTYANTHEWKRIEWPYNPQPPYNEWECWIKKFPNQVVVIIFPGTQPDKGLSFVVVGQYTGMLPGVLEYNRAKAILDRKFTTHGDI